MKDKKNVLILGAYGFLGSRLVYNFEKNGTNVLKHGRSHDSEIKFNNHSELKDIIDDNNVDAIINLVAATDVDLCETDLNYALEPNIYFLEDVVKAIESVNKEKIPFLVHISSDQVYQGNGPHFEKDARPLNIYSLTKYFSENIALNVPSTVLRTNFIGKSSNPNRQSLSDFIVYSLRKEERIEVFEDVFFNPLYIDTLCNIIDTCLNKEISGVFNVGSSGGVSKADFAFKLAKILDLDLSLMKRIKIFKFSKLIAPRPSDMRMDCGAFESRFNTKLPSFDSQLKDLVKDYV